MRRAYRADHARRAGQALGLSFVVLLTAQSWAFARPSPPAKTASLPTSSALASAAEPVRPVPAWTEFCGRYPIECIVDVSEAASITMSKAVWDALGKVNERVNSAIVPLSDLAHWGVADRWDIPTDGYGDCEDYQLLKRKLLADKGLPRRAMRTTVVTDQKGEGHAVLMVRTNRGDFILDNKTNRVLPWAETGYTFIKREGQDSTGWVALVGVLSPVATANR